MPFTLRQSTPTQVKLQIEKLQNIYGKSQFEKILSQRVLGLSQLELNFNNRNRVVGKNQLELIQSKQLSGNRQVDVTILLPKQLCMEIYQNIQSWSTQFISKPLDFKQNCPQILKCLSGITFTNLRSLTLQRLNIDNIQPLSFMDCTYLDTIDLENNKIVSIKTLNKAYFPLMRKQKFNVNPFHQTIDERYNLFKRAFNLYNIMYMNERFHNIMLQQVLSVIFSW